MKIRNRVLIYIFIAAVITFLSIYILSNTVIKNAFSQIENDLAVHSAEMVKSDLDADVARLDTNAIDWAKWDDTYKFVMDRNEDYVAENLAGNSLKNININAILFANKENNIYYMKTYDFYTGNELNITPEISRDMQRYIASTKGAEPLRGLLLIDGKLMVIASENITDSAEEKQLNDSLIFVRYLYPSDFESMSGQIQQSIDAEITSQEVTSRYPEATPLFEDAYIYRIGGNLTCLIQLYDVLGEPIGIIHVNIERNIYTHYHDTVNLYLIIFSFIIILLGGLFFLAAKRGMTDKIQYLDTNITKMIAEGTTNKIYIEGDDEIVDLARKFNELVVLLEYRKNELAQYNAKLEEANYALTNLDVLKDNFLSNVSHEIRTPLTSLKSYTQLMLSGAFGKINNEQRNSLKILLDSIDQLDGIVGELLDISRLESGKLMLNVERCDINILIREELKEFQSEFNKIGCKPKIVLDKKNRMVDIDVNRIKQVLRNIISNSIKYRSDSKLELAIRTYIEGKHLIIAIEDNGIGISKENLPHLFERFYQVDQSMKRKVGGTGLGLAIVKSIINAHKGKISIESDLGKGTRVYIRLRLRA